MAKEYRTVSVVVPTHNYGRYIGEALTSVLDQTYRPLEVIIVDDGSTDETERVVSSFGHSVSYIKQPNLGVCAARNRGIAFSSGQLVAFLDADDTWSPEKLEKQVAKFTEDEEIGLVHCGMREFDGNTDETIGYHLQGEEGHIARELALCERSVIPGPGGTIVVKREVFQTVGDFDTRIKNGEDWEFCLRVARRYKVGFVREPLVNYRKHGTNAHLNIVEMERSTMLAWARAFDTDDKEIMEVRRRSYGNLHKVLAGSYLKNGNYAGFLRNVIKSLWYRPSYFIEYLSIAFHWRGTRGFK